MRHAKRKRWAVALAAAFVVQVSGCGTLLYPERKGQSGGKVDAQVAILDGIGLLFFIIPGVIAFIVDFDNGTIYLPGTLDVHHREHHNLFKDKDARADAPEPESWTAVRVGPDPLDAATLRTVVAANTGKWLDLDDPRLEVRRVASAPGAPVGTWGFAR